METDMMNAIASDIGLAASMPLIPKNLGRMTSRGIRNSPCLDSDTRSPCLLFPVAEKYSMETGCMFWKNTNIMYILRYFSANS